MLNEDHILIIGLNGGSKAAFGALYDKYAGRIYNYTALMLRDKTLAEDITQMCFIAVWEHRESIDPEQSFVAYLYAIARNTVYKESRRMVVRSKYVEVVTQKQIPPPLAEIASDSEALTDRIDREIIDREFQKNIASLPAGCRRVFELRVVQHMSNAQIAAALGLSVKTVEAQITKSVKILRKRMAEFGE